MRQDSGASWFQIDYVYQTGGKMIPYLKFFSAVAWLFFGFLTSGCTSSFQGTRSPASAALASGNPCSGSWVSTGNNIYFSGCDNGNVGIGTTNPNAPLQVVGNVTATNFTMTSDARLKKDVQPLSAQLEKVTSLKPVSFYWNSLAAKQGIHDDRRQLGFIAQDIEKIFPEAVRTGTDGYKSVNYPALISPVVQSLKEVEQALHEKDAKIEALEQRIERLEKELTRQLQAANK